MARTATRTVRIGDRFNVLHSSRYGTTYGALEVCRVTTLSDGRLRLQFERDLPSFPLLEVTVDPTTLRDRNGYCEPA